MNLKYKPGMRAVKTSAAVFICLSIGYILKRESMFYAAIAAVICMQPTFDKSKNIGINRFIGSMIGGTVGFFSLQLLILINQKVDWLFIIINSIAIILIIYLCNIFNIREATTISCVVLLNVVTNFDRGSHGAFLYVLFRMIDTTIGIVIAVFINKIKLPQNVIKAEKMKKMKKK